MSAMNLPDQIPEGGLLVGWRTGGNLAWPPAGFSFGPLRSRNHGQARPVLYRGDGHLMTIAPTGAGKGTGAIIPALLRHTGSVIVVDPKGENHAVTARHRRAMGQRVILLDPFEVTGKPADSLNPLDLVAPGQPGAPGNARMLAEMIVPERSGAGDPYWDSRSRYLLAALMLHQPPDDGGAGAGLVTLRRLVQANGETLKALGEAMRKSSVDAVRAGAAVLGMRHERTLDSILTTAQSHVAAFVGERIEAATSRTSFPLDALVSGDPVSIYIVIPPHRLGAARHLLRLWIGTLIALVLRRRRRVQPSTLFLLDEAAQLGPLDPLRQAITLLRGYGLQTWSFWQDLSQLQETYPEDWETMYNNCHVHQVFGITTMHLAASIETINQVHRAEALLTLERTDMQLAIAGSVPEIARRPDYLNDPCFRGRFDANPFYA